MGSRMGSSWYSDMAQVGTMGRDPLKGGQAVFGVRNRTRKGPFGGPFGVLNRSQLGCPFASCCVSGSISHVVNGLET